MEKPFEIIVKQINDKRLQIAEILCNGSVKDHSEYKSLCGEVRGLLTAQIYIEDLSKRMEQNDE